MPRFIERCGSAGRQPSSLASAANALRLFAIATLVTACAGRTPPPSEALWYSRNSEESIRSFETNSRHISIVSPQVFAFDSTGNISGSVAPRVIAAAKANGVKLVPLVMNPGFDQPLIHRILSVPIVRAHAIQSLADLCRTNHLDGIQYDIENVHVTDKDALTSFVRESVDSLHHAGCTVSAAVVPRLNEDPGVSAYQKWIFDNWRAAYDYKALADTLDFISYMTYAQHTGGSTPGPVAGFRWMENSLKYVLSLGVPPSKISLGIPAYSDYWFSAYDPATGSRTRGNDIAYPALMSIMSKAGARPQWDEVQKAPYAMWEDHGVFEHAWLEDARAFREKLELVRKYKLRGYSVWLLGLEDPATWGVVGPVVK